MQWRYAARLGFLSVVMAASAAHAQVDEGFARWLAGFKEKAAAQGISQRTIDDALTGIEPDAQVVTLDQKQPENKVTLTKYISNTLPQRRIERARRMMHEYHDTLHAIGKKYGVQPKYIVALWAIESDFGDNKGEFSVVQSLATLAYEGRRADFFGKELLSALTILDTEHMRSDELSGSWAGAMGDCQFMPSTYLSFAVDGNGDGKRDIWDSPPDIFASIANYLHSLGWNAKQGWGRAAVVPDDFSVSDADISVGKPASYWRKRGLKYGRDNGDVNAIRPIPNSDTTLYAMYPGTEDEGAYLVTENYKALLQWNRSRYFATAVGTLADAIGE